MLVQNEEKTIAFGSIRRLKNGEMNLHSAYVTEPYRGQGIYKRLVTERVEIAQQRGARIVSIFALDTNKAKGWLGKYGFETVDSFGQGDNTTDILELHLPQEQ